MHQVRKVTSGIRAWKGNLGKYQTNIIENRLDLVNVVGAVSCLGEADLAIGRPAPLHLVAGAKLHHAVVGGGGEVLDHVEPLESGGLLRLRGVGDGVPPGLEEGDFDGVGGQLDDDGGGSRVWVVGGGGALIDAESLGDDAISLGEGGDEGFVLGGDEDGLEDTVIGGFGGSFPRFGARFLVIGDRDTKDADGEGLLVLLEIVDLVLELEDLGVGRLDVPLNFD